MIGRNYRYTIPPQSTVHVSKKDRLQRHKLRIPLSFDRFIWHRNYSFLFEHDGWQIQVRDDLIECGDGFPLPDGKVVYSLEFEIEPTKPGTFVQLIAPLDGRCGSQHVCPKDDKLLINVGLGDDLIHPLGRLRVISARPYRITETLAHS